MSSLQGAIRDLREAVAENAEVRAGAVAYVRLANSKLDSDKNSKFFKERDRSYAMKKAQKYYKIWVMEWGKESSIHAFIDIANGNLYKPAGLNKPAKGARGNVTDEKFMKQLESRFDIHGGHLYVR